MTDRKKLIELLHSICENHAPCSMELVADHLLANGVTFATDINVGNEWVRVEDKKPPYWVSILGHMTDAEDFPAVRECFFVNEEFWFPALHEAHPVDRWMEMPE